ncbi:1-acyl-sn-glycerol-3-phosphate acyltransferase alpha isoform X2 [Halyomorpha halys]|uniref:1-acyl-sn-glycerol-3-phosphate acyltransferase alpha isoform X2 n=1 Tax=Halyomorpha halys TaxID=286706 RepID=UPI0034D310F6
MLKGTETRYKMLFPVITSKVWRAVTYYTKFFLLGVWMLSSFLIVPLMCRKPGHYKNKLVFCTYSEVITKIIGVRWTLMGKENIITNGGSVVVMNHQSILDVIGTKPLIQEKAVTNWVSKKEVWYMVPLATVFWLCGAIFIDRSHKKETLKKMNRLSEAIIKDKKRILIFPEGTRGDGNKFLPFKKGAFHIAISAQAPIQPVIMGKYKFLDHKNYRFDSVINTNQLTNWYCKNGRNSFEYSYHFSLLWLLRSIQP